MQLQIIAADHYVGFAVQLLWVYIVIFDIAF